MNLSIGIVGLPNVGKSTLFNALTSNSVPAENYPFCTIEPNVGVIPVNDNRLDKIAEIENSEEKTPAVVKFVDIAGLVKGASRGEGLGNKFLSHIREVDAVVQVIRSFKDQNIAHVDKSIDPKRDIETIESELIIKDTETVEKIIEEKKRPAKADDDEALKLQILQNLLKHLNKGKLANTFTDDNFSEFENFRKELFLLTDKPIIYVINEFAENINDKEKEKLRAELGLDKSDQLILLDAKLEVELSQLRKEEKEELLTDLGLKRRPLDDLVETGYTTLGLISFLTANKKQARAWTLYKGDTVLQAARTVHQDFAQNFIAAEVAKYPYFVKYGGWKACRDNGKIDLVGREYIVSDGDIIQIRHNT